MKKEDKMQSALLRGVTVVEYKDIAALIELCNQQDGLDFPVPVDVIGALTGSKPRLLLHYDGQILAGFVYLQDLQDGAEIELYGMVHPEYRCRGIASRLLQEAREICQQEQKPIPLLVNDGISSAGRAFALAQGYSLRFSEYRMVLKDDQRRRLDAGEIKRPEVWQDQLVLRRAESREAPTIAGIIARAFNDDEAETMKWVASDMLRPEQHFFLALLDGIFIGTLRTIYVGKSAEITAFGVLPEYQGHGYGRQMLLSTVDMLLEENWEAISLDVETENTNALSLYQVCGFHVAQQYEYYHYTT